jgi:hypothetical protein
LSDWLLMALVEGGIVLAFYGAIWLYTRFYQEP